MEENQIELPEGWMNISKLENFGRVFNGLSGKKKDDFGYGEPYIPYVNVFKNAKIDTDELNFVNIRRGEKQNELMYGDIIFTTSSETVEEVGMTSVFLAKDGKYFLNSFCFIFRLSNLSWLLPEYAQFLFRSDKVRYNISLLGQGSTRYNLSKTRLLKELTFNIPQKITEQRQIANILSKVDEAITQKEKLIAKYSRIKTGLMQDLLNKGIDKHGNIRSEETHQFKDSPLGRIPVEWDCPKIEEIKEFITSGSRGWARYYSVEGNQFIRITNLKRNQIDIDRSDLKYVNLPLSVEGIRSKLLEGDLLISITADLGIIGVIPPLFGDAFVNQHIALVRLNKKIVEPKFIGYFLTSQVGQAMFSFLNDGGAKAGLNLKTINQLFVLKPQIEEQNLIVQKIEKANSGLLELNTHLSKLQYIKKGLMQDLLSGKVRVNHLIQEMASA